MMHNEFYYSTLSFNLNQHNSDYKNGAYQEELIFGSSLQKKSMNIASKLNK